MNLGTPARADLESAAFGHSATPARAKRGRTWVILPFRPHTRRTRSVERIPDGSFPPVREAIPWPRSASYTIDESASVADVRTPGRSGHDDRSSGGSSTYDPRPSSSSIHGSRDLGAQEGIAHCIASRPSGPVGRTDPGVRARRVRPPSPQARRGRRSAPGRCGPSPRCVDLGGRDGSSLRLLTYGAVHRVARYHRVAPRTVHSSEGHRCRGRGWRRAPGRSGRLSGRRSLWIPYRRKAPRLGDRPAASGTEQRPWIGDRSTMETRRHAGGKVYPLFHRPSHR